MRSRLLIPLLLGSLGACALSSEQEGPPADPGDFPDPDPDIETPPLSPAQEARALLAEWSGCMSLASFTSAEMASTWSQIVAADGSRCTRCHTEATPSFPVSSNPEAFFQVISEHTLPMLLFFTVDLTTRPGKVIMSPSRFEAVGTGTPPNALHPRFTVAGAPTTALTSFYNATVARKAANACDPPRLKD